MKEVQAQKGAAPEKAAAPGKSTRMGKAYEASSANFRKVAERIRERAGEGVKTVREFLKDESTRNIRFGRTEVSAGPAGGAKQTEGHRRADRREKDAAQTRRKPKTPVVPPPQPGKRR